MRFKNENAPPEATGRGMGEAAEALDPDYNSLHNATLVDLLSHEDPSVRRQAGGVIERRHRPAEMDTVDQSSRASESDSDDQAKKSAATRLVEIAEQHYRFGVSPDGEVFAIPRSGPEVVVMLRGNQQSLRGRLARRYFTETRRAAPQQALTDALAVVDGLAQEAKPQRLYMRVAQAHGSHFIDLGDSTGRAIEIASDGWAVIDAPPVLFKRTALTSDLPEPARGGDLDELWALLNVDGDDVPLLAAWLVAALFDDIAHPVLSLFGEQGSAKTTTQRTLTACIDPSPVPTRKPPRDADSWTTAAAGSWVVGIDNISTVPDWLSDSLCRASTGEGDVRRRLYTDGDFHVVAFRRCVTLNGIDLGALRGDLTERLLPINLQRIPDNQRKGDAELARVWSDAHPRIFGALLDLAAGVVGRLPSVHLESKPRMADFATILAAVDQELGTEGLDQYIGKQRSMARDSLTADTFIQAMQENLHGGFKGTAAELLDRLTVDHPPKGWPATARQATQQLRRQAPSMRKAGWTIDDDGGANHRKVAVWTVKPPQPERSRKADPQHPHDPPNAATCGSQVHKLAGQDQTNTQDGAPRTRNMGPSAGYAGRAGQEYGPSRDVRDAIVQAIGDRPIDSKDVLVQMSDEDVEDLAAGAMPAAALRHLIEKTEAKRR